MCVEYTDLNEAFPKNTYPLLNINKLMNKTSGFKLLSFIETYFDHNKILMHPTYREKQHL